jgi:antitoxin component YwqK of YwqJK toxin-antitoxin module
MKRFTVAAFALLLISAALPCSAQQKEKRRPGPFLIWGPVHTIRDEHVTITMKNGEPVEGERVLVHTLTYNEDGTKQEDTSYQPDGSIMFRIVYLYDPDGKILETTRFNGKDTVQTREVSHYDDQKRASERITYRADDSVLGKQIYSYNGNQRIIESTMYGPNGAILRQNTTTSYLQPNRAESLDYDGKRVVRSESSITRTPEGGQMYETQTDGKTTRKEAYNPIQKGDERVQYNPDGTIKSRERFTREFDSHGNMIKTTRSVATGDSADFALADVTYRTIEYYQ